MEVCLSNTINGNVGIKHNEMQTEETNSKKFFDERHYMIPFKTRIKQPFEEGQTIHAVGMIKADPKRITIDFHKGADKNADLPLHLSIRFDEGKIVYNSFVDGNWLDNEKRLQNPFQANSEMDIRIRLVNNQYQIFANRLEWGLLSRNVPVDGVSHVSISGDLATLQLFHYGGKIFTKPYTAIAKLVPNMRLDISLLPTGERFDINIYRANRQYALQVSVRFNEGMVVRNAMENNIWGREEREGGMPIEKGYITDITIINKLYSFQIFFNGNHFSSFAHRSSPEDIATLEIDGDYELFSVTLNNAVEV